MVHHNLSYTQDSYVYTYSYITDRDFTIYKKNLMGRGAGKLTTITYRDSLPVYSFNDDMINEYSYDSLRRMVYFSLNSPGLGKSRLYKSYWKDTNLITREEKVELNKNDTIIHRIKLNSYDDQDRLIAGYDSGFKDTQGKEHRSNAVTEYDGDSLVIQDLNYYDTGQGWTHSISKKRLYPPVFFGDTMCTSYCEAETNQAMEVGQYKCCTKYEWGKRGTKADWGYIVYRSGNIYGTICDYTETGHGHMWTTYECKSETGPDHWREDLKNKFKPTYITCISLNDQDQPVLEEGYNASGELWYRNEYYYKKADYYSKRLLPEPTTCQIIRELNPDSIYYDVFSRRVNIASGTQFLFESGSKGTNRVLFIME
jgi:hypothetical protein